MAKRRKETEPEKAAPAATGAMAATSARDAAMAANDEAIDLYAAALTAVGRKDWTEATRLFEEVVRESDMPELTGRARQYLSSIQQNLARNRQEDGSRDEDDPFLRAVYEKNRGDLRQALEIARKDGRDTQDERFAYLAASIHAVEGRTDEAARALARAVELNSKNRIHAFHDADFADLRRQRDYRHLFGLA
jgi:tetratricopeptide (TPR) repeat protein